MASDESIRILKNIEEQLILVNEKLDKLNSRVLSDGKNVIDKIDEAVLDLTNAIGNISNQ